MSNHSAKKEAKERKERMFYCQILFGGSYLFYLIGLAIKFIWFEYSFSFWVVFGAVFLLATNLLLIKLIDTFHGSYFYPPIIDLSGVNIAVQVCYLFHWKAWFIYLLVPCYGLYKASIYIYNYLVNSVETDQTPEEPEPNQKKRR